MKITIVKACSDLGVKVCGSEKGPLELDEFDEKVDKVIVLKKDEVQKELEDGNKKRNINYVNKLNEEIYNAIVNEDNFVITLGGDHSIAIGSDLGSAKKHKNIGIIWIDAHSDYHNMDSTITGNIHGMPLCSITGQNGTTLNEFFDGEYIDPANTVIIGARDVEKPETDNLLKAGVNVFTTHDIKDAGVKEIMAHAFGLLDGCDGIHISYDLDVIDPEIAPGVSVPAVNGINEEEAYEIMNELVKRIDLIKSFDLVEFNPDKDIDYKTEKIANNLLDTFIKAVEKK